MQSDFDPMQQVRFRGKALHDLTHAETLAALVQALAQVKHLEDTRPPGVSPAWPTHADYLTSVPFPPRSELSLR